MARIEAREVSVSGYGIREGLLLESARVTPGARRSRRGARAQRAPVRRAMPLRAAARRTRAEARAAALRRDRPTARLYAGRSARSSPMPHCCTTWDTTSATRSTTSTRTTSSSHAELLGVSPEEQILIAHVARYHRGARAQRSSTANFAQAGQRAAPNGSRDWRRSCAWPTASTAGTSARCRQVKVRWLDRAVRVTAVPAHQGARRCGSRCGARPGSRSCCREGRQAARGDRRTRRHRPRHGTD